MNNSFADLLSAEDLDSVYGVLDELGHSPELDDNSGYNVPAGQASTTPSTDFFAPPDASLPSPGLYMPTGQTFTSFWTPQNDPAVLSSTGTTSNSSSSASGGEPANCDPAASTGHSLNPSGASSPSPASSPQSQAALANTQSNKSASAGLRRKELLTEEEKKANHIYSEQKRRQNIKVGLDDLCVTVPALQERKRLEDQAKLENTKLSVKLALGEATILEESLNYTRALDHDIQMMDAEIKQIQQLLKPQ
ncbi:hypothetical protein H4R33_004481 [Dimargaris cristalligena]|uniref:BHLH domain-containing protein n=1 Tax=Dimargaris cristalligena TaxID=215637 RepID=A0A4P9ZVZ7_9FUNG|nr:hypothetical protein H4R33_004481 [Dimargaris cristalligena]RKP37795.1 hypothetical protein BJ085DRAFT_40871 [Dimargaris cristalligena]|eukprot:RKP37795.1 hypothetical protein BJ085DRAFT_40871 [Dimargaris cristalligena]